MPDTVSCTLRLTLAVTSPFFPFINTNSQTELWCKICHWRDDYKTDPSRSPSAWLLPLAYVRESEWNYGMPAPARQLCSHACLLFITSWDPFLPVCFSFDHELLVRDVWSASLFCFKQIAKRKTKLQAYRERNRF